MLEERRHKRKAFDYTCTLDFRDGMRPRACEVVDISRGGARIAIDTDTSQIPEFVKLIMSPNGAVYRDCKVAWRTPNAIGVQFINGDGSRPGARRANPKDPEIIL